MLTFIRLIYKVLTTRVLVCLQPAHLAGAFTLSLGEAAQAGLMQISFWWTSPCHLRRWQGSLFMSLCHVQHQVNDCRLTCTSPLVQVLMATNRIDILDAALLRPGRIDRKIEFPNPSESSRFDILKIHSRRMNMQRGIDLKKIADKMTVCTFRTATFHDEQHCLCWGLGSTGCLRSVAASNGCLGSQAALDAWGDGLHWMLGEMGCTACLQSQAVQHVAGDQQHSRFTDLSTAAHMQCLTCFHDLKMANVRKQQASEVTVSKICHCCWP